MPNHETVLECLNPPQGPRPISTQKTIHNTTLPQSGSQSPAGSSPDFHPKEDILRMVVAKVSQSPAGSSPDFHNYLITSLIVGGFDVSIPRRVLARFPRQDRFHHHSKG